MINERYAPAGRIGATAHHRPRPSWRTRLAVRPALLGRERVAKTIGHAVSVPVQLALAMSLIACAFMLYLFQASQTSVLEMNIAHQQATQMQLQLENAALQTSATRLRSIQRVDTIATNQLHMTKLALSQSVWIYPIVPVVRPPVPAGTDTFTAQRQSEPLSWMYRLATFVGDSL